MNQDQLLGILRVLLPTLLSYCVGKGWISSSQVADLTAAGIAIAGAAWSYAAHTDHAKIAAVAAMPEVKSIVTTKAMAEASPSVKVTNGFVAPVDTKPVTKG